VADTNPARALNVVKRVVEMCEFIEHPAIQEAIEQKIVPRPLPPAPNAVVDISVWVGLGAVGLWAALDAFAERAGLKPSKSHCPKCKKKSCISALFAGYMKGNENQILQELEDFRHLYAHNDAGEADTEYFRYGKRHVLAAGTTTQLSCGAQFYGHSLSLDLQHLRYYATTAQSLLGRFP
jgi:hypothetical protein